MNNYILPTVYFCLLLIAICTITQNNKDEQTGINKLMTGNIELLAEEFFYQVEIIDELKVKQAKLTKYIESVEDALFYTSMKVQEQDMQINEMQLEIQQLGIEEEIKTFNE